MIIAMGLGAFSPPIGVGMFVTCSIADTTMENAARHMVPYLVVLVIGLLLVAFVPWFSLIVPRAAAHAVAAQPQTRDRNSRTPRPSLRRSRARRVTPSA